MFTHLSELREFEYKTGYKREKNMKRKANNNGAFVGKKKMSHRQFFPSQQTGEGGVEDA